MSSSNSRVLEMTRRPSATVSLLRLELVHVKTCPSPQAAVEPPVDLISCGERSYFDHDAEALTERTQWL